MRKQGFVFLFFILLLAGTGCYKNKPVPSADFSWTDTSDSLHPHQVTFVNRSQNSSSYDWTFGDTQSSTGTSPVHLYPDSGDYDVLLKAYSDDSKTEWAQKTQKIHVK